ncbi:hypothetical protein CTA2_11791 [Colletotrichum tanaceti]|uniref:DUF7770 domain-containing protein n=1 Tax=Colletotrichum tanaceti TaxID=1306861 RepID=A0A4U6X913_9PEZI|nr:hypothetical protein CTA2_11791 [Colletotrichum tanaceti]TKW51489.1 hypothetical protein CTA1_12717 [Colletotrichum tanaceti]
MAVSTQPSPASQDPASEAADISSAVVDSANPRQFWSFQPPPFEPVQYIPKKDRDDIRGFAVLEAGAVAHEPLANGGNHWTFYLTVAPDPLLDLEDRRLVQLDSTPSGTPSGGGGSGSKANIVVSLLEDRGFSRAQCICRLKTRDSLTVGDLVDAITDHGREKYDFDDRGRGCKKWTADQMDLFLRAGILVQEDDVANAKKDMMFQWDAFRRTGEHSEWAVGVYY